MSSAQAQLGRSGSMCSSRTKKRQRLSNVGAKFGEKEVLLPN
jgi:hypothetical protein